ncbi:MAG: TolC family protein [Selenomonas sp.]|nr:TolC family protein [Selenomonas sp.]
MKKMIIASLVAASCLWGEAGAAPYGEQETGAAVDLSLAESVQMALDTDESIGASEDGRDAAKWQLSSARRGAGPIVDWSSRAVRLGGRSNRENQERHEVLPQLYPAYNNTFSNSWTLTIPIYTGGQREGQIDSARYQLNQADLDLENTRQQVRYRAAEAYANLLHRENLQRIAEEAVDMGNTQLKLISDQYSEGMVAKADVLMMEVRLANYRQNLSSAKGAVNVARSTLASVVGLPQDSVVSPTDIFTYEPYPRDLPACEDYALAHRPDGLSADYAVKAAQAQQDAAKAGYRPRVTGTAGQSISSNIPFRSERSNGWEAGISVNWSVFDNGVTSANVKRAGALVEQAKKSAARTQKTIRLETRTAYIQMKTAEENIHAAAAAVKQAEESYMIAQVRYEEGVDILLSVTDAQEKLTQARSNYSTALYQYNLYRATLEKAMGVPVGFDAALYAEAERKGAAANSALQAAAVKDSPVKEKNDTEKVLDAGAVGQEFAGK